jgi:hypothetical protein
MEGGGPAGPFLVPQFIDVETKIIGSITTRQFLLLMIAGMLDFIFYKLFFFNTFIIIAVPISAIFGIVAFFKVNGMPFHYFFLNVIQTTKRPKLRVWQKVVITHLPEDKKEEVKKEFIPKAPMPSSRLSSLSLVVDTGGSYKEED